MCSVTKKILFSGGSRRRTSPVQLSSSFRPFAAPAIGTTSFRGNIDQPKDKGKDHLEDNLKKEQPPVQLFSSLPSVARPAMKSKLCEAE